MTRVLGHFVRLQRGTTYKSALLGRPGPFLLGLGSIGKNGGFRSDNLKTYGGESDPRILLSPGDIYVSLKDVTQSADLLGAVARVPQGIGQGRLTQDTVKLVFKAEAPRTLIYWVLQCPQYRAYCRAFATGTTNLGLQREDFLSFPIPEETAEVQTVVDLLETIESKIKLNRKMNATLEAMARALFRDWFVDFGPTRAKMVGAEPYLSPDLWSLFPDRLDDEGKPVGWEMGTLNDLASLNPESWTARSAPAQVSYVDLANTKWGSIDKVEDYAWADAPSRARRILRAGDTIVGTVRPGNGSFCYVGEDGLTGSTGFAVLRPLHPRNRAFVWCAATSAENIDRLAHLADGGAYPAVRPDEVAATEVVIPGSGVLEAFRAAVSANLDLMEANKAESLTLAQTRDLLLPRLMSGELRMADLGPSDRETAA